LTDTYEILKFLCES